MYSFTELSFKYLSYYFTASNGKGHGIHSPFIFDFVRNVLNGDNTPAAVQKTEELRQLLLKDKTVLHIEDFGAGSSSSKTNTRTVASIARHAVKSRKYSGLLYRIANYYQPSTIIELGTSLGITTSYLSLANESATVFTLEGAGELCKVAKHNFETLQLANIKLIEGNSDYTLPSVLYNLSSVDLAFIDGNHRREPTINYFQWLLPKTNDQSIFIFDDIHWSRGMEQAWNVIREHPSVRCSVDLFFLGIIFFRNEFREKQHFTLRF